MKIWTYQEMKAKVFTDIDLLDETFVSANEVAGYFNEALGEAAAEICELNQDYFRTKYFLPLVTGTSVYSLPFNIYANKIRGILYSNGSLIYQVRKYRRRNEFENIVNTDQFGAADAYKYDLINDVPGQSKLELHPTSRDTAILPPAVGPFTPMTMWYIRNVARVPMVAFNGNPAELCNLELIAPSAVNPITDQIQTLSGVTTGIHQQGVVGAWPGSIPYVTGDIVQVSTISSGVLPAPLVVNTNYYVIALGSGVIKLATSLVNAFAGTAIDLTTAGTVHLTIRVGATTAITNATLIDIPEFSTFIMQWVKCRVMGKEDPRLAGELETLVMQKKEMVDTLTNAVPDDDDQIQADFSHYEECS